ncbi:hypothetical protein [Dokdonella sp.]|uniref:hypothetical protein n=1 Tax=Dokdonella sp. TaxID=2291710 RepID=UPI0025C45CE3|nr:hypothetical protein [Dokdonella sp.]MBX3693474.1 hypothetical protein [Dokdonella sp.]
MRIIHLALPLAVLAGLAACNREQPSGLPASAPTPESPAAASETRPPPPPVAAVKEAAPESPPPLDEQLAAFEATGYPVCDDYMEKARQCINTRMGPDDRLVHGRQLKDSVRIINANIKAGSENRIEQSCKRMRMLGITTFAKYGCTDL